jgi:hypothetical protein
MPVIANVNAGSGKKPVNTLNGNTVSSRNAEQFLTDGKSHTISLPVPIVKAPAVEGVLNTVGANNFST